MMYMKLVSAPFACAVLAFNATAVAEQFVVIQSTNGALKAGEMVDSQKVTVGKDASVTLLTPSGKSIFVDGPHSGPVTLNSPSGATPDGNMIAALNRLVADNATSTSSLGVVRAAEKDVTLAKGELSAEHSGPQCIRAGVAVMIKRAVANEDETAKLKMTGGKRKKVKWAAGEDVTAWPKGLPIKDGGVYLLRRGSGGLPGKIQLHILANGSAHDSYFGAWAAASGCTLQADMIAKTLTTN
jgi:hypothetical protein